MRGRSLPQIGGSEDISERQRPAGQAHMSHGDRSAEREGFERYEMGTSSGRTNASPAAASFFPPPAVGASAARGWAGRGTCSVNPRATSHRHPVSGRTVTRQRSRTYRATFGPVHTPPSGGRFCNAAYRAARRRAVSFGVGPVALPPVGHPVGAVVVPPVEDGPDGDGGQPDQVGHFGRSTGPGRSGPAARGRATEPSRSGAGRTRTDTGACSPAGGERTAGDAWDSLPRQRVAGT